MKWNLHSTIVQQCTLTPVIFKLNYLKNNQTCFKCYIIQTILFKLQLYIQKNIYWHPSWHGRTICVAHHCCLSCCCMLPPVALLHGLRHEHIVSLSSSVHGGMSCCHHPMCVRHVAIRHEKINKKKKWLTCCVVPYQAATGMLRLHCCCPACRGYIAAA